MTWTDTEAKYIAGMVIEMADVPEHVDQALSDRADELEAAARSLTPKSEGVK